VEDLPTDSVLRGEVIDEATESLRLLYRLVERLMSTKEEEERAWVPRHSCHLFVIWSGCFGQYLHKIGKEESSKCHHCQDENDSAEHTLFECPAWDEDRRKMGNVSDLRVALNPGNIVRFMLSGPKK